MSKAALLNPDPPEPGAEEGDDELIYDQAGLDLAGCTEEQVRVCERGVWVLGFGFGWGLGGKGFSGLGCVYVLSFDPRPKPTPPNT